MTEDSIELETQPLGQRHTQPLVDKALARRECDRVLGRELLGECPYAGVELGISELPVCQSPDDRIVGCQPATGVIPTRGCAAAQCTASAKTSLSSTIGSKEDASASSSKSRSVASSPSPGVTFATATTPIRGER